MTINQSDDSYQNMRILFFNYEYPPLGGGAANATKNIMNEMSQIEGAQVDVVTSSIDSEYHEEKIGQGVTLHRLSIGKNENNLNYQTKKELMTYLVKAYFFARTLHKKNHYDLSHSFFTVPCGFISLLLYFEFKLPYIISLRGSDVPGYSQRFKKLYIFIKSIVVYIWKKSSAVVANSKGLRELALKSNPKQKIDIIYNGINIDIFKPGRKENSEPFEIICASRLSHRKGFNYVIDAVQILREKYPHIHVTIAGGEGDAGVELKKQVDDLKLGGMVTFTGHYFFEEIAPRYQQADVFVFPSLNEGMSNNMLEAMASGLPIIMTPTGGAEELVEDGKNGFLVAFKNSQDIADKIEKLIANPELVERMGKRSREIAERMSWKNVASQYFDLYKKVSTT